MRTKTFFRRRISFKNLLILISLIVVIVVLLIVSTILYTNTKYYIIEKMDAIDTNKLYQYASDIDNIFTDVDKIAAYLQNNKHLIGLINKYEDSSTSMYNKYLVSQDISLMLSNIKQYNDIIESINIITKENQYDSNRLIFTSDLTSTIPQQSSKDITFHYPSKSLTDAIPFRADEKLLESLDMCAYFHFSLFDENGFYGNVFIILKNNFLTLYNNNIDSILLLDDISNTVYKGKSFNTLDTNKIRNNVLKNKNNKVVYTDKNFKVYRKELSFHNWTILYLVKMNKYTKQFNILRSFVVICFILCIVISFIFSGLISSKILKPVLKLTALIKKYKTDSFDTSFFEEDSKKSKYSLREKIFYYFIITILLPVTAFVGIFYFQSNKIINEQISQNYSTVLEKTADNLTKYMLKKQTILQTIVYNALVQNYITEDRKADIDQVYDIIEQNIYLGLNRDTVSIYDYSNQLIITNQFRQKVSLDKDYYEKLKSIMRGMDWFIDTNDLNRITVTLGMPIVSVLQKNNSRTIGYAKIDMDYTYISELFSELKTENTNIYIVDEDGCIVTNPQKKIVEAKSSKLFENISGIKFVDLSGEKYMIYYKKLGVSPWYLVSEYNYHDFSKQSLIIFSNNVYLFIIVLLFVTVLSYYISIKLLNPVNTLNKLFEKLDISSFDEKMTGNFYIDEINDLCINFNKMLVRLEDLIDELMISNAEKNQLEIEKKSAEIIALQAQINPHFLYNTLDNIIYMIKGDFKDNAVTMIKALSRLFRYGISKGDIAISIREEIEYAKAYTNIMTFRYNNRIRFVWNVDDSLLEYRIIKLILQPVIENSIYHGINKGEKSGTIEIKCISEENSVKLIVSDDGRGIPQDELDNLIRDLNECTTTNKIGIFNVQSRIRLHYGEGYGVGLSSMYGHGTTVTLTLPKIVQLP